MLRKMMKEKFFCGLDLGSQRLKAGLLNVSKTNQLEFVGGVTAKTYGYKDGQVTDLGGLAECIQNAIQSLSSKFNVKFKELSLGVGADIIQVKEVDAAIPLVDRAYKIITQRDIDKAQRHVRLLAANLEEEVLHDLPQLYRVDDLTTLANPRGLSGRKLAVKSLMMLIQGNRMENIIRAVHQAGYDISYVALSSFAAADVVLTPQDKNQGTILFDLGAKATTLLVFKSGILKTIYKIPIGGDTLTQSISSHLHLPWELAEEIKKSYASVLERAHTSHEEILVKRDNGYIPIQKSLIDQAVASDVEELMESVEKFFKEILLDQPVHSAHIIGGGAFLNGFLERLGEKMNCPVRLARIHIPLQRTLSNAASFSPVFGLAYEGYKRLFRYSLNTAEPQRWRRKFFETVKELYEEYF